MFLVRTSLLRLSDLHIVRGAIEIGQSLLQRNETTIFRVPWALLDMRHRNVDSLPLIITSRNFLALSRSVVMNK